jgi:hypothetical protein
MTLTDALFILFIVAFVAAAIFLWVRDTSENRDL